MVPGQECPYLIGKSCRQTTRHPRTILVLVRAIYVQRECVVATIGMSRGRGPTTVNPGRSGRRVRQILLLCGVLIGAVRRRRPARRTELSRIGRSRALRITGALLIAYALFCFTGPTLFEMRPRGTQGVAGDASHITGSHA